MTGTQLNAGWRECAAGYRVPVDGPCPRCGATPDEYCAQEWEDLAPIMNDLAIRPIPEDDGKTIEDCKERFPTSINFQGMPEL